MPSAVAIVLCTPELLQHILLNLSMRELLTKAPRVCRNWRAVIDGSAPIQQKLYFRSIPSSSTAVVSSSSTAAAAAGTGCGAQHNPLLAELFPHWFGGHFFNTAALDTLPLTRRRDAFLRRGASWRRMLVQQPAITTVALLETSADHRRRRGLPRPGSTDAEVQDGGGHQIRGRGDDDDDDGRQRAWAVFADDAVRMGAFYDLAVDGIERPGTVRFVVWADRSFLERRAEVESSERNERRYTDGDGEEEAPAGAESETADSEPRQDPVLPDADVAIYTVSQFAFRWMPGVLNSAEWASKFRSEDHESVTLVHDTDMMG
ncbi:hypothetical protein BX600DRAFT_428694 [Xylariales sp. PMI_506]|nr:hypothetical protein BX600DRAFT_428694 [Xylariales sp. PMI_506]